MSKQEVEIPYKATDRTPPQSAKFCIVVDEEDNQLGFSPVKLAHKQGWRDRTVALAIIRNSDGAVLLQQRSADKKLYPNFYSLSASGHVIPRERIRDAVEREMLEELGVGPKVLGVNPYDFRLVGRLLINVKDHPSVAALFTTTVSIPIESYLKPNAKEVQRVLFVPPLDLKALEPNITPLLR